VWLSALWNVGSWKKLDRREHSHSPSVAMQSTCCGVVNLPADSSAARESILIE
jgi:hypothetical protein